MAVSVQQLCILSAAQALGPLPASFVACFLRSAMMEADQISSGPSMSILVAVPCSPWCQQVNNSDTRSWRLRFREESSAVRSGAQQGRFPKKTVQPPASREARRPQRVQLPSGGPLPRPISTPESQAWLGRGSSMLRFPFPVCASEGRGQWGCSSCCAEVKSSALFVVRICAHTTWWGFGENVPPGGGWVG